MPLSLKTQAVKVAAHWNTSQLKTTPKALTVTDRSKSTTRALSPQRQEDSKCLLSQSGTDGLGHQLEGKLSCMAMASFLGMVYVHKPFFTMSASALWKSRQKWQRFFEDFFWIWDSIPKHQGTHARTAQVKSSVGRGTARRTVG